MKKLISIIAAVLFFANLHAQLSVRPEIGLNLADMKVKYTNPIFTTDMNTKVKTGLKAGAYLKIPVIEGFYVEPGLLYSMKGYSQELTMNINPITMSSDKIKYRTNVHWLELPVNLGYDFHIGKAGELFVAAGPYFGYALSGKQKADDDAIKDHKLDFGPDTGDDMRSFDLGFNFGLGYQIPLGLYIRAQYGFSATNLAPEEDYGKLKNKVFSFSIGYDLPLSRN